jgi:hypothetical protein
MKIQYKINCLSEFIPIRGNVCSIDEKHDRECENKVIKSLENGNEWAWCCVEVIAYIDGIDLIGVDHLGGCSYKSEKDFKRSSGYYQDMKHEAKRHLLAQINSIKKLA